MDDEETETLPLTRIEQEALHTASRALRDSLARIMKGKGLHPTVEVYLYGIEFFTLHKDPVHGEVQRTWTFNGDEDDPNDNEIYERIYK